MNTKQQYSIFSKERDFNLDLIRVIAIFLLISVHFFWNSGFYQEVITGCHMFVMVLIRTLSMTCVPLFLLLTGYLLSNKNNKFSKEYYFRITKLLGIYFLSTILIVFFKNIFLHQNDNIIWNILTFQQYAWYVNMYLGLFLLIPFLNIIWYNLDSEKRRKTLLLTLAFITIFPSVVNAVGINWWLNFYPLTYYFIGAFLAQCKIEGKTLNAKKAFFLLCLTITIFSILNFYRSYNHKFLWDVWNEWGSFQNTANAVLIFLLINSFSFTNTINSIIIKKIIHRVATLSYGMYLTSWIMDQIVYNKLIIHVPIVQNRFYFYLPCVVVVFLGSLLLSYIVTNLYNSLFLIVFSKTEPLKNH